MNNVKLKTNMVYILKTVIIICKINQAMFYFKVFLLIIDVCYKEVLNCFR